jgi:hypothetical protein
LACIQVISDRDEALLMNENNGDTQGNMLQYQTLDAIHLSNDVLAGLSSKFHAILDKGCLDTFLF